MKIEVHPNHKLLLEHLREAVVNKWDGVVLIDGIEGSGKSGLALLSACYLDPSFNIDRIVFTPDQFDKAILKAKVGQAIVWDEFITGGLSDDFMTKIQKTLIKRMTMIRKKRLYIFWIMPYFFIVRAYFAVARSRFLLHTYTPDGIERGYWQAWNYGRKKTMYFKGRKEWNYCVSPFKTGNFDDFFSTYPNIIDVNAYEKKKDEATTNIEQDKESISPRFKKVRNGFAAICRYCIKNNYLTGREIGKITGYSRTWIHEITEEKTELKVNAK